VSVQGERPDVARTGVIVGEPARPVLGLDIGGTKLAAGVVAPGGRVLSLRRELTRGDRGEESMLRRLRLLGEQALAEVGTTAEQVAAIGIACGGPLDPDRGVVLHAPNLPGWRDVPVAERLSAAFGLPAWLGNDGCAGALAEWWFGAGRGESDLAYLTVSTGVGGGAVVAGQLFRGSSGNGGEFGHLLIEPRGRRCGCGRRGCLEALVSGTGIAARAVEELAATPAPSMLRDSSEPTAADVARAARNGDAIATRIWDDTTAFLGEGIATIVNLFEPRVVVLGGGVANAGEQLIGPARQVALSAALPTGRPVRIVRTELGVEVGVVGAACLALERMSAHPRHNDSANLGNGNHNNHVDTGRVLS
jgi:glucokinase